MDRKLVFSVVLVALTAFQSGCGIIQERRAVTTPVFATDRPTSSNSVYVSGLIKEEKVIPVPDSGISLVQVVAQVTVARPEGSGIDPGDLEPNLWMSIRRNGSIQRQVIFVPLSFVRFGSAGNINVSPSDVVQVVHADMLPRVVQGEDRTTGVPNEGTFTFTGLVESPGKHSWSSVNPTLSNLEDKSRPKDGWSVVAVERVSSDFSGYEQFIVPINSNELYGSFPLINGDVITYAQANQIPTLVAGKLEQIRRLQAKNVVVTKSNRTVRRNTIAERLGSALPRFR